MGRAKHITLRSSEIESVAHKLYCGALSSIYNSHSHTASLGIVRVSNLLLGCSHYDSLCNVYYILRVGEVVISSAS